MVVAEKTITSYFGEDHSRLDQLFDQFQALKACDYALAKQYFKEFKFGLQRHIVWEEEILFPLFEARTGLKESGPAVVMRLEHQQIKEALKLIHKKVQQEDPQSDGEEAVLLSALTKHNAKEENMLYPMIDQLLSEEERKSVFLQMENLSDEWYRSCCGIKNLHS